MSCLLCLSNDGYSFPLVPSIQSEGTFIPLFKDRLNHKRSLQCPRAAFIYFTRLGQKVSKDSNSQVGKSARQRELSYLLKRKVFKQNSHTRGESQEREKPEISTQAKGSMITEYYLEKCLRRRQHMKLPFAGHLEEKELKIEMTCSSKARLAISVSHKGRQLRKGKQAACTGAGAPVCLAPVLQHSTYEAVGMDKEISEQSKTAHFSMAYSPDLSTDTLNLRNS